MATQNSWITDKIRHERDARHGQGAVPLYIFCMSARLTPQVEPPILILPRCHKKEVYVGRRDLGFYRRIAAKCPKQFTACSNRKKVKEKGACQSEQSVFKTATRCYERMFKSLLEALIAQLHTILSIIQDAA